MIVVLMTTGKFGPNLGIVLNANDHEDAIEKCFRLAIENNPQATEKDVLEEIQKNMGYGDEDGDWSVQIGSAE